MTLAHPLLGGWLSGVCGVSGVTRSGVRLRSLGVRPRPERDAGMPDALREVRVNVTS